MINADESEPCTCKVEPFPFTSPNGYNPMLTGFQNVLLSAEHVLAKMVGTSASTSSGRVVSQDKTVLQGGDGLLQP